MASSETRLCRSAWANAGHARVVTRPGGEDPEHHGHGQQDQGDDAGGPGGVPEVVDEVASITAPRPSPARGRRRLGPDGRRCPTRPVADVDDGPSASDQPGRHAEAGQVADGIVPPDHRRRAPGIGLDAGRRRRRHQRPHRAGRLAGPRVDDVVHGRPSRTQSGRWCPRWPGRRSGWRPPGPTESSGCRAPGRDPDRPPPGRAGSGHGHVSPQIDQGATPERGGDPPGRPVGGEGLGRGPEVDVDAGGTATVRAPGSSSIRHHPGAGRGRAPG